MPKYCYLVVEGPHDVAFVGRFLRLAGMSRVQKLSGLDSFWRSLVPREFPPDDDLLKRVPVPSFFSGMSYSVAVSSAVGDSRIAETIEETLSVAEWDIESLEGIGILLDADTEQIPAKRFGSVKDEIRKKIGLFLPDAPGVVSVETSPRSGIFIMPDNHSAGTLEDLLIQSSEISYPKLLAAADIFVNEAASEIVRYNSKEKKDFLSPSGINKATVGVIANALRPGKAVQVSIEDNRWITEETLMIPDMAAFDNFIRDLLNF